MRRGLTHFNIVSIVFGLVSIAFAGPILGGVVGAKGDVAKLGAEYLRVNSGGAFSIFFLLQLTAVQRALGSSKMKAVEQSACTGTMVAPEGTGRIVALGPRSGGATPPARRSATR